MSVVTSLAPARKQGVGTMGKSATHGGVRGNRLLDAHTSGGHLISLLMDLNPLFTLLTNTAYVSAQERYRLSEIHWFVATLAAS